MQHIFYLLLKRLRIPMITIISVYAISVAGFVLIPGQDDQGNVWHMDFFHAFYFVSFMGSTIGFGEVPFTFTVGQRVWATISIYGTVVSWLYSMGTILSLFQDPNFQRLTKRSRFIHQVKKINQPYYLICGFGSTGSRVARLLDQHNIPCVIIESKLRVINELETTELGLRIPSLCANASDPDALKVAGIENDLCVGVMALTIDDQANLAIAINSKLVKPDRLVISGTQSKATTDNLASFGTDMILDPFEIFADHLILMITQPYKRLIYDIFVNPTQNVWSSPHQNTAGSWVICGYGRMGRALEAQLKAHGIPHTFISTDPQSYNAPPGTVKGTGTEAPTLIEAGIKDAVGIIAGTNNDADNLSIIITARDLNPDLITIARQNVRTNKPVFKAANVHQIMEPGRIVANEIYMRVRTPLLTEFFTAMRKRDEASTRTLLQLVSYVMSDQDLNAWTLTIDDETSPAITEAIDNGKKVALRVLDIDPRDRTQPVSAVVLMLKRGNDSVLVPPPETALNRGDLILCCGQRKAQTLMGWTMKDHNTLRYIQSGKLGPDGFVWQWLKQRQQRKGDYQ